MPEAAASFAIADLAAFDDEALRTFLDPRDGGVPPQLLGRAAHACDDRLVARFAAALPADARRGFRDAHDAASTAAEVAAARRHLVDALFWPLVYWHRADDYVELIRGERIPERLLDELDLDRRDVCDIGAGSGRFTLPAARRARHVVAVDAVPVLLSRLQAAATALRLRNVTVRRGRFTALPLDDASVDLAVFCSSFTADGPHGGPSALDEAERIVRRGGSVAVIWPQQERWLMSRGYEYVRVRGAAALEFRDVQTAEHLCRLYYAAAAARWVRQHRSAAVPYDVLGVRPPNDLCIKHIG